jgi:hypothetical protein
MAVRLLILLIIGAALPVAALGQEETVVRDVGVYRDTLDAAAAQPFQIRRLVVPASERVWLDGTPLDTTRYRLDARNGLLWLTGPTPAPGTELVVAYRVLPFELRDVYRLRGITPPEAGDSTAAVTVVEEQPGAGQAPFDPFGDARLQRSRRRPC